MAGFRAAVARRIITPQAPNFPPPVDPARIPVTQVIRTSGGAALDAQGVYTDADGTPSELFADAIVIEDAGGMRVAIVCFDVLITAPHFTDEVKTAILQRTGIPPDQVLLNVSHTHNAPCVSFLTGGYCLLTSNEQLPLPEYVAGVTQRISDAVAEAVGALQPASLHYAKGQTSIAAYRRDDGARPRGVPDPQDLDVLSIRGDGGTIANLFSTPCHPVTMYGQPSISSDFISDTRKLVQQSQGGIAVFLQGYGGDLMPWRQLPPDQVPFPDDKTQTGAALAADIQTALANVVELSGPISMATGTGMLPLNPISSTWNVTDHGALVLWANTGSPTLPLDIQILRIGTDELLPSSWTLVALTHEVVSEWVSKVKARLGPIANLTLAAYTNAVQSYLPTPRMIEVDKTNCAGVPFGYEGCYSFGVYYNGLPLWTEEDVLKPIVSVVDATSPDLTDDFQSPIMNPEKWNIHVLSQFGPTVCQQPFDVKMQIVQGGGSLRIIPEHGSADPSYSGYVSAERYDVRGAQTSLQIQDVPQGSNAELLLSIGPDGRHLCRFSIQGVDGGAAKMVAVSSDADGNTTSTDIGAYDPGRPFIRLRHDLADQMLHWETSADAVNWQSLHQETPAFALSAVLVEIAAGTSGMNHTTGPAVVGKFGLLGSAHAPKRRRRVVAH